MRTLPSKLRLHRHRILPGHMGGLYTQDNIELLTVPEHAEAHRLLFENFGCLEDKMAWKFLSGQATVGDIAPELRLLCNQRIGDALRGVPKSKEHRACLSAANKGVMSTRIGVPNPKVSVAQKGIPETAEARSNMSAAHIGVPLSAEHRASQSAAQLIAQNSHDVKARKGLETFIGKLKAKLVRKILASWLFAEEVA